MKAVFCAVIAFLCLSTDVQAGALQACKLTMPLIDYDPKGTNVRETPGGRVSGVLSMIGTGDDWIEVHIVGQSGDWFLIDKAEQHGDLDKVIFRGKGYIHRSVLGTASGMENGGVIYADHDTKSRPVLPHGDDRTDMTFLGCWQDFAKVTIKKTKVTGWTREICLNQRTTCV